MSHDIIIGAAPGSVQMPGDPITRTRSVTTKQGRDSQPTGISAGELGGTGGVEPVRRKVIRKSIYCVSGEDDNAVPSGNQYPTVVFTFNIDGGTGSFAGGDAITWDGGSSSGVLTRITGVIPTGQMWIRKLTGSDPEDNDAIVGPSGTADVNGTPAQQNLWRNGATGQFFNNILAPVDENQQYTYPQRGVNADDGFWLPKGSFDYGSPLRIEAIGDILNTSGSAQDLVIVIAPHTSENLALGTSMYDARDLTEQPPKHPDGTETEGWVTATISIPNNITVGTVFMVIDAVHTRLPSTGSFPNLTRNYKTYYSIKLRYTMPGGGGGAEQEFFRTSEDWDFGKIDTRLAVRFAMEPFGQSSPSTTKIEFHAVNAYLDH